MVPGWLQFNTYERSWIRYLNVDSLGEPLLLAVDDMTMYPFRRINNGKTRVRITDLEDLDFVQSLATDHDLMYDETLVDGMCDVARLRGISTDLLCTPGTEGMENGHIFLVLYHPLTLKERRSPPRLTTPGVAPCGTGHCRTGRGDRRWGPAPLRPLQ